MENEFYDIDISNEYFLKLAPDFSVFEIAEKAITENDEGFIRNNLFSDNPEDVSNWRRAMIKTTAADLKFNDSTACKAFIFDKYTIYIAINEYENISITDKTSIDGKYFIGVCF